MFVYFINNKARINNLTLVNKKKLCVHLVLYLFLTNYAIIKLIMKIIYHKYTFISSIVHSFLSCINPFVSFMYLILSCINPILSCLNPILLLFCKKKNNVACTVLYQGS